LDREAIPKAPDRESGTADQPPLPLLLDPPEDPLVPELLPLPDLSDPPEDPLLVEPLPFPFGTELVVPELLLAP